MTIYFAGVSQPYSKKYEVTLAGLYVKQIHEGHVGIAKAKNSRNAFQVVWGEKDIAKAFEEERLLGEVSQHDLSHLRGLEKAVRQKGFAEVLGKIKKQVKRLFSNQENTQKTQTKTGSPFTSKDSEWATLMRAFKEAFSVDKK